MCPNNRLQQANTIKQYIHSLFVNSSGLYRQAHLLAHPLCVCFCYFVLRCCFGLARSKGCQRWFISIEVIWILNRCKCNMPKVWSGHSGHFSERGKTRDYWLELRPFALEGWCKVQTFFLIIFFFFAQLCCVVLKPSLQSLWRRGFGRYAIVVAVGGCDCGVLVAGRLYVPYVKSCRLLNCFPFYLCIYFTLHGNFPFQTNESPD